MTLHYGGDYNPEQWPEETWLEDVRLMREAGVTLVSLGIFSWARIQPAEGEFDWDWLDRIVDLLHENGVAVDLATGTASPPPWAAIAYPGILPVDVNGATYWPGSRQHYAPTSSDYRRLASELVTALAARYSAHPAVVMWHVNNEFGCHVSQDYSDGARDAYRGWLERKYGTIEALNAAWGTAFWSQLYRSFDQVFPPRKTPTSPNPTGVLDFRRFSSDALLELYVMERDIIRSSGALQPITTNFMGLFPGGDYWHWAKEVDFVSDDNYADPNDPESFRGAAFSRDLMRCLKPGTPWLLMEQATNSVNWRPSNAPKAPGQMAALSMQAIARGSMGAMFFQWRQSRRGSEKFHSAMVPQAGLETRTWREVTALGALLPTLPALGGTAIGAEVAIVFDWENWWAVSGSDHPTTIDYPAIVQRWYSALHRRNVAVDFVQAGSALGGYRLVIAPQLYLLRASEAQNLATFVAGGGHLLASAFTDVVDENDAFRDGGFLVGMRDTFGVSVDDFGALVDPAAAAAGALGQSIAVVSTPAGDVTGEHFAEELRVIDAEVLGSYSSGRLLGAPAFTTHGVGTGQAHYFASIPDVAGTATLVDWALERAGAQPVAVGVSEWVEVIRRGDHLVAINHGAEPATVPLAGVDAITGEQRDGVTLQPFGWAILAG